MMSLLNIPDEIIVNSILFDNLTLFDIFSFRFVCSKTKNLYKSVDILRLKNLRITNNYRCTKLFTWNIDAIPWITKKIINFNYENIKLIEINKVNLYFELPDLNDFENLETLIIKNSCVYLKKNLTIDDNNIDDNIDDNIEDNIEDNIYFNNNISYNININNIKNIELDNILFKGSLFSHSISHICIKGDDVRSIIIKNCDNVIIDCNFLKYVKIDENTCHDYKINSTNDEFIIDYCD